MKVEISDVHENEICSFLQYSADVVKGGKISVDDFNECLRDNRINFYLSVDPDMCFVYRGYLG